MNKIQKLMIIQTFNGKAKYITSDNDIYYPLTIVIGNVVASVKKFYISKVRFIHIHTYSFI